MIRLMVYANDFEIELLFASSDGTPGELKHPVTRPDLIRRIVDAYKAVLPGLQRHADGWPSADRLRSAIVSGNPLRGLGHVGAGHDTSGSDALIRCVDAGTPERPLNVAVWGGQTDLAQALWRVKSDRGSSGLATFLRLLRVYEIDDQDRIGDWLLEEFPRLWRIVSMASPGRDKREGAYRGMYLTGDESLTSRA